jgi:hypothetical protein
MSFKISPNLEARLQAQPDTIVHLIVRLVDPPTDVLDRVRTHGLTVRHEIRLIRALSISGPSNACLTLLSEPWVSSIEEDHKVQTVMQNP